MRLKLFSNQDNSFYIIAKVDMFGKIEGYLSHDKSGALFGTPHYQSGLDNNVERFKFKEGADQTVKNLEKISFCEYFKVVEVSPFFGKNKNNKQRDHISDLIDSIGDLSKTFINSNRSHRF